MCSRSVDLVCRSMGKVLVFLSFVLLDTHTHSLHPCQGGGSQPDFDC